MTRAIVTLRPNETLAHRVRRLQAEAQAGAKEHVGQLATALRDVENLAFEIAGGGDAYPPGIRDLARRILEECETRALTLNSLLGRLM